MTPGLFDNNVVDNKKCNDDSQFQDATDGLKYQIHGFSEN